MVVPVYHQRKPQEAVPRNNRSSIRIHRRTLDGCHVSQRMSQPTSRPKKQKPVSLQSPAATNKMEEITTAMRASNRLQGGDTFKCNKHERRIKTKQIKSARPTMYNTLSVCTGWIKKKLPSNAAHQQEKPHWALKKASKPEHMKCRSKLAMWNPEDSNPCNKKFQRKVNTVNGRKDLWVQVPANMSKPQ